MNKLVQFKEIVEKKSKFKTILKETKIKSEFNCLAESIKKNIDNVNIFIKDINELSSSKSFSLTDYKISKNINAIIGTVQTKINLMTKDFEHLKDLKLSRKEYFINEQTNQHNTLIIEIISKEIEEIIIHFHQTLEMVHEKEVTSREELELFGISDLKEYDYFNMDKNREDQLQIQPFNDYYENRRISGENILKSIEELRIIFIKIGDILYHHSEMIQRIDDNISQVDIDIESGRKELIKTFHNMSLNRSLFFKILFILVSFFVVFLFLL